jgi:hypothetical protein
LLSEPERTGSYKYGGRYNWFHHHLSMAQVELALSNIGQARDAIIRAEEVAGTAEEIVHMGWACKVRGDIERAALSQNGHLARHAYSQGLHIAAPRGLRPLAAHCHAGLAELHRRLGETDTAKLHAHKAELIFRELGLTFWTERLEAAGFGGDHNGAKY